MCTWKKEAEEKYTYPYIFLMLLQPHPMYISYAATTYVANPWSCITVLLLLQPLPLQPYLLFLMLLLLHPLFLMLLQSYPLLLMLLQPHPLFLILLKPHPLFLILLYPHPLLLCVATTSFSFTFCCYNLSFFYSLVLQPYPLFLMLRRPHPMLLRGIRKRG